MAEEEELAAQKTLIRDTYGDMKGWELIDLFLAWMEPHQIADMAQNIEDATDSEEDGP
jgi:hypothetical protein